MKLLAGLVLCLAALPLRAELIRVSYSGAVSSLTYADCTSLVNGSCDAWTFSPIQSTNFIPGQQIAVGETFSGSFVYDSSASFVMSSDGYQAVYLNSVSLAQFDAPNFSLPSIELPMAPSSGSFSVVDGRNGADVFQVSGGYSSSEYFSNMYLSMVDLTGTAITGFAAPTSLLMSQFGYNTLQIGMLRRADGDQVQLSASLASVSFASAVPEPQTLFLMLLGSSFVVRRVRTRICAA